MIGINIRGVRHLYRVADTSLRDALIYFREGIGYQFCKVMKTEPKSPIGERLLIFNNHYNYGNIGINSALASGIIPREEAAFMGYQFQKLMEFGDIKDALAGFPFINEIILLPPTFTKDYNSFLSTNAKMIRTLTDKFGYSTEDQISKRIYMYTEGSKNFYMWAINNYFQNGTSLATIKRVMTWNESYGQLIKKLSKSTITAYTSNNDMYALSQEISNLRKEKRVNDVINSFNTAQKRMLKGVELSDKDKTTLAKFYRLSEAKKTNFIRKMSTIEDFAEFMRQMRHVTSTHFDWNKESFMDFIKNVEEMKYEVVYDKDDIILLKVTDYETIKHLAKTTNWCISKNKSYWNNYVEHQSDAVQYIVFDFSKKEDDLLSIIGFTTQYNRGITHAHDFVNNDMMKQDAQEERVFLESFISNYRTNNGIYSVLDKCGIDINLVVHYDKALYEWNKEAMYTYLYECVKKDNVDVLVDKDNLVAISVTDRNIRYFLGDTYIETINENHWGFQHIIFMDFSMSQYDPNRIQFAIIVNGDKRQDEAYCMNIYNEHSQNPGFDFNTKLAQFGLPYDIIRRSDDPYEKARNAFLSYNIPMLNETIKDGHMLSEVIFDYIGGESAVDCIVSSIVGSMSFDYLNLFYSRGLAMHNIIGNGNTSNILKDVLASLIENGRRVDDGKYNKPTSEDIQAFYDRKLESYEKTMYVGTYLAIVHILDHEGKDEHSNYYCKRLVNTIFMGHKKGEVFDDIMERVAKLMNFSERSDGCSSWVGYVFTSGNESLKKLLEELASKHQAVAQSVERLEAMAKKMEGQSSSRTSIRFEPFTARVQAPRMATGDEAAQVLQGRVAQPVVAPAGYQLDDDDWQ